MELKHYLYPNSPSIQSALACFAQGELCRDVTNAEIEANLKAMGLENAPRPDGFPLGFFKCYLPTAHHETLFFLFLDT